MNLDERFKNSGVLPSPKDARDYNILACAQPVTLPETFQVSNAEKVPVYNQGPTGMCVAFTTRKIKEINELNISGKYNPLSHGFIYLNRYATDLSSFLKVEGLYPREVCNHVKSEGICELSKFQFDGYWANEAERKPIPQEAFDNAKQYVIESYVACNNFHEIRMALFANNSPVLIVVPVLNTFKGGFNEGFEFDANKPPVHLVGYHAMTCIGWKTEQGQPYLEVMNSWGADWGINGKCYLPMNFPIVEAWAFIDIKPEIDKPVIPVPKPDPSKPVIPVTKKYAIQMGDFMTKVSKDQMCTKLQKLKIPFIVITLSNKGNIYYKIQIGVFTDKKKADVAFASYAKHKFPNLKIVS